MNSGRFDYNNCRRCGRFPGLARREVPLYGHQSGERNPFLLVDVPDVPVYAYHFVASADPDGDGDPDMIIGNHPRNFNSTLEGRAGDDSLELVAKALQDRLAAQQAGTHYIKPGSPWQNGTNERRPLNDGDKECRRMPALLRTAAAGIVLVAAALVALAFPLSAAAQTVTDLVSNTGQDYFGRHSRLSLDRAQRFTTGPHASGYILSNILIRSADPEGDVFTVSLCAVDSNGLPAGWPHTSCTELRAPSSFAAGILEFTAPANTVLELNTTYSLLVSIPSDVNGYTHQVNLGTTQSDNEDAGALPGWSIANHADAGFWGVGGVGWQDEIYGSSLRIVIRGALAPLSPVAFMPAVTSTPSLTSTASATADTYGVGETIRFTVTFSEAVEVTGAPGFGFSLGNRGQTDGTDRRATHDPVLSTETTLVFGYTVQAGDRDTDGIWVGDHTQTFRVDADNDIRAKSGNEAVTLNHAEVGLLSGHKVGTPPVVAKVTSVAVTSTPSLTSGGATPDTYGRGETVRFTVTFSEAVTVTSDPEFEFSLRNRDESRRFARRAAYDTGRSTETTLVFSYTVQAGDRDNDGIWVGSHSYTFRLDAGDHIRTASNDENALLDHDPLTTQSRHKIDGSRARRGVAGVTSVRVTSTPLLTWPGSSSLNTYGSGEAIRFTVTFSEAVTVTGNPGFNFNIFSSRENSYNNFIRHARASYDPGRSTATRLVFGYTVQSGDHDADGIVVEDHRRTFRGVSDGRIRTTANNVLAVLNHRRPGKQAGHKVDGSRTAQSNNQLAAPVIVGAPTLSEAGTDGAWTPGETVEVQLTFSESVTVVTADGTPSIGLQLGSTQAQRAPYASGTGTAKLVFRYTLTDADGPHSTLRVPPDSLALNGGTIRAGGLDADLAHNGAAQMGLPPEPASARATRGVADGPTASFSDLPATHDGEKPFKVKLSFSEEPALGYETVRDSLLEVSCATESCGKVTGAARATPGNNSEWKVTVKPSQGYDITLTLPVRACGKTGAVCVDGRPLAAAASATIPGKALTASLTGPAEHDGSKGFTVRLTFSMEPDVSYKTVRDTMFIVKSGTIKGTKRVKPPHDREFDITVEPDGNAAVSLSLASLLPACGETGAVCTAPGRKIEGTVNATIPGPAALSVADADVEEGPDAALKFVVSLSRQRAVETKVDYATPDDPIPDDTATKGSDYTATSGTLTFAAGETSKTVSVPVLDDVHDEGAETLTLTLFNARGAVIADASATGTISNSDPMPKGWLARFGRTSATQVMGLLDARFDEARAPASQLTLGGRPIKLSGLGGNPQGGAEPAGGPVGPSGEPAVAHADPFDALASRYTLDDASMGMADLNNGPAALHADPSAATDPAAGAVGAGGEATLLERLVWGLLTQDDWSVDRRQFLSGSSFDLSLSALGRETDGEAIETARVRETPGHWSLWGRGALTRFAGQDTGVSLDGDVLTGLLGLDYSRGRWLAGLGLAYNDGDGAYRAPGSGTADKLDSTLVSVHPYLHYALTDRLSAWGTLGYGAGGLRLRQARDGANEQDPIKTDIQMRMGALGLRGTVFANATTELALKSDLMWVRTASSETAGLAAVDGADASRVRLLLTGRHRYALATGAEVTPNVELGLRYDGGDAETGAGVELGGGLRYADPVRGLTVEATARALLAHEDGGYEEWGMGGSLKLDPGRLGRGLSLRLASGWGLTDSGTDALWQQQTAPGLTQGAGQTSQGRIRAEWTYGLDVPWTHGLLTPYGSVEMAADRRRTLRLGWRFELGQSLSLSLTGERREALHVTPEHALMLQTTLPLVLAR